MATWKNVPLTPEELPRFIDILIAEMGLAHIMFACMDPEVVAARSRVVNQQLDVLAVARVMELVAGVEGKESLHDPIVQSVVSEIMGSFEKYTDMTNICWPPTFEMVEGHYAGKLRGPTVALREDGTVVTRWWKGLEMHRDPSVGPASIEVRGSYRRDEYWVDGQRHRPWSEGPAIVITDDIEGKQRREVAYWFGGQRHRPHTEGPALVTSHYGDNFNLSGEEYFEHGKLHRPSHLGPAVTHWDSSGRKSLEEFLEEGELHRDPKEGPASFMIRDPVTFKEACDDVTIIRYCVRGQSHRDEEDGPAFLLRDNGTGVLLRELYDRQDRGYRIGGPAVVERNTEGKVVFEAWCDGSGWFSRDPREGPAVVTHDTETGVTTEEFMQAGEKPGSDSMPAVIKRDQSGKAIEALCWNGSELVPFGGRNAHV
ncbi:MAG: hypothetical protein EKK41_09000 [Hyphomicrobiales bacterium]|nr:MAG: hypothetical protein EKK41_09000 [Hyphomicrobiales bacterium]